LRAVRKFSRPRQKRLRLRHKPAAALGHSGFWRIGRSLSNLRRKGGTPVDIAWIVELAVRASKQSDLVIEGPHELPETALRNFWKYSHRRISDWIICRNRCHAQLLTADENRDAPLCQQLETLASEFFVSDVLIRFWSAVLIAADHRRGTHRSEPIARYVHIEHLQARCQALKLLADGRHLSRSRMVRLNTLRHSAECWTDLLLGRLVCRYDVSDFAFDKTRAREFGEGQLSYADANTRDTAWDLISSGAKRTFPICRSISPWRTACLRKIAGAVLATFPAKSLSCSASPKTF
jgi:hypothetical protein